MSDTGAVIRTAVEVFGQLKAAYDAKDDVKCTDLMNKLMKSLIRLPTFLNPGAMSTTKAQEVMLTREALELGVLIAARQKDLLGMESYYCQLAVYYNDIKDPSIAPSERRQLMLGMNLMRLLVSSGISTFHSELETIPKSEHSNMFIKFPIQLERYLMEGSYHKLLHARGQVPSNDYISVVELLEETVRNEIARCIPKSYPTLTVAAAQKMLMLGSAKEVLDMASHPDRNWQLNEAKTMFTFNVDDASHKKELPFAQMLEDSIHYAAELQKVV